jgi:hypothetical protein
MNEYISRTIQHLEQIEAEETFPAIQAASLLAETLCDIAPCCQRKTNNRLPGLLRCMLSVPISSMGHCA